MLSKITKQSINVLLSAGVPINIIKLRDTLDQKNHNMARDMAPVTLIFGSRGK